MEQHPNVEIVLDTSYSNPDEAVQSILRRGIVNDLPDIAILSSNHVKTLSESGVAISLESFRASETAWNENYSESVTRIGMYGGQAHALAVGLSFPVFYINLDLVGEDQEVFVDWDRLLEVLEGVATANPGVIPGYFRDHPWFFQAYIYSKGDRMMDPNELDITFQEDGRELFDIVARFGELGQSTALMTEQQAQQSFAAGQIAVMLDASSGIRARRELIGDGFTLGIAQFPVLGPAGTIPAAGTSGMILTEESERQEAAWAFLKFVSGTEGQEIVAEQSSYIPANEKAIEASERLQELLAADPVFSLLSDLVPLADRWYIFPGENGLRIDAAIKQSLQDVVTLKISPGDAIARLESEVEELLGQ